MKFWLGAKAAAAWLKARGGGSKGVPPAPPPATPAAPSTMASITLATGERVDLVRTDRRRAHCHILTCGCCVDVLVIESLGNMYSRALVICNYQRGAIDGAEYLRAMRALSAAAGHLELRALASGRLKRGEIPPAFLTAKI